MSGCNYIHADQVVGSGVSKTEKREVPSFDSIDASGALDVEVVCQKEPSLELEGDDNLLPLLKTEVRGGTLYIKSEKSFSARKGIRVRITAPNIQNISSSGASSFQVSNIKNEKLRIQNSGASNINLSGQTVALELELSGASKADTEKLIAERVTVNLSGAGKANVYASDELNAEVSGAGSVTYSGDPKTVNRNVSGVGSISRKSL
jgi:hypothetical protein